MNQRETPQWQYVPLADYAAPQATISRTIRGGIKGMWKRFQRQEPLPVQEPAGLEYLPPTALEKVAAPPDWSGAVRALEAAVRETAGGDQAPFVLLVAGLPGSGNDRILGSLASAFGWRLVQPPGPDQILSGDTAWLDQALSPESPWVLPDLAKVYLRHVHGLDLVRGLVAGIGSGRAGRCIVGCDSWALAYLRRVLPGSLPGSFPGSPIKAVVAQAMDDQSLGRWLGQRAEAGCGRQLRFRQADTGEPVLPGENGPPGETKSGTKASAFVNQLAARSFGIPGVALEIWKRALKREPNQPISPGDPDTDAAAERTTIWVEPWEKLPSLIIPSDLGPASPVLLHTLLLHNGLPRELAAELLPFSVHEADRTAAGLIEAGIVMEHRGLLTVTPLWYPSVRAFLNGEGYLTDQF